MARKRKIRKAAGKRGRKHIFTPEQKRVLERMIRGALKEQLRGAVREM